MTSSQPDPARRSYVPGFKASAVGGATDTTRLLLSSSRVNERLSAETGGQPGGTVTRTDAGHFLQEEVPDEIAAAVRQVAARVRDAAAAA